MAISTPTSFCIAETRTLDCQFGPHYYKEKTKKGTRVFIQGSRKIGCLAHLTIKKMYFVP